MKWWKVRGTGHGLFPSPGRTMKNHENLFITHDAPKDGQTGTFEIKVTQSVRSLVW